MLEVTDFAAEAFEQNRRFRFVDIEDLQANPSRIGELSSNEPVPAKKCQPLLPRVEPFYAAEFSPDEHSTDNPCFPHTDFLEEDAHMIHHIVLYKLKPEVTPERLEVLLMQTRMQLLKIPVAMNVRCGRRIDPNSEWPFFFAVEFDSKERMAMFVEEPIYIKFIEETIKPNTQGSMVLDYETDPKRKYL
jgi:Stress responsive A/B Barrel Domain